MIINGIEFAFDTAKLEDLDRYEEAYTVLQPAIEQGDRLMSEGKLGTAARTYLKAFKEFFCKVAGEDLLGDSVDYNLCLALWEDFTTQMAEQKQKTRDTYFSHKKGRR